MPYLVEDEVRDVHDIVNRLEPEGLESATEPLGALRDLESTDHEPLEARTELGGYVDGDGYGAGALGTTEYLGEVGVDTLPGALGEVGS